MKKTTIRRGDIFFVDFDPSRGTEIQKLRPALVCSTDLMNDKFHRIIVAPITSNLSKIYPFEYEIKNEIIMGKVMFDQLRSIDKIRLGKKKGSLALNQMQEIDLILKMILNLK